MFMWSVLKLVRWQSEHLSKAEDQTLQCTVSKTICVVIVWMLLYLQILYVENLMPTVRVLGGRAFGRWLVHKGRTLMNEISSLIKEAPRELAFPFHHVRTLRLWQSATWKRGFPRTRPCWLASWPWIYSLQNCGK